MKCVMNLFDTIHGSIPYTCPLIYLDILYSFFVDLKVKKSVGTINVGTNISVASELGAH